MQLPDSYNTLTLGSSYGDTQKQNISKKEANRHCDEILEVGDKLWNWIFYITYLRMIDYDGIKSKKSIAVAGYHFRTLFLMQNKG